ncbi:MAG TPA: hypothetical protein VIL46_04805, partial [Gemmataceae bacterium]
AAEFLRKKYRDPHRGEPRPAGAPEGAAEAGAAVGPEVRLFEPGGDGGVPPMWATHPANHLREANAKERYVPAAIDGRSPWLLFEGREELCRRVALRFYQVAAEVPDGAELADPTRVQQFIDAEHEEMTFDERYQGAYDGRPIFAGRRPAEPDEVDALFRSVERGEEWPAERLAAEHAALYAGLGERMAVYQARRRDLDALLAWANDPNAPGEIEIRGARFGKELASNLISEVEAELADDNESFAEFDRNVLLAHARMARQLGGGRLDELARRYRFQLLVQGIHQAVAAAQDQAGAATSALMAQGPEVPPELFQQAVGIYRAARQLMADRLDQAAGVPIPPLANFPSDMPLGEFLLSKPLLPDSAGLTLEAAWINKLMEQLGEVRQKSARLFFKNMGNILAFQEQLARDWHERTAPDRPGPSEAGGAAREEDLPGTIPVEDEPDGPPR